MNKYQKETKELLMEMFKRVGEDYNSFMAKEDTTSCESRWFEKHQWTKEQEEDFKKWAVNYLRKKFKWSKKKSEEEMDWFLLMWGWKTKK